MNNQNRKSSSKSTTTQYTLYSRHLSAISNKRLVGQVKTNFQSRSLQENDHNNVRTMHSATSNHQQISISKDNNSNCLSMDLMISNTQPTTENGRLNKRKKSLNQYRRSCSCIILLSLLFIGFILGILLPFNLIKRISSTEKPKIEIPNTFTSLTTTTSTSSSSTSSSTTSTITTTIQITTNITTGTNLGNWFGELSVYLRCSGLIKDALIEIIVLKTVGLSSSGQYETYGGGVFTQTIITNSTHVIYRWKMNTGKTIVCSGSHIQFAAQFGLTGTAHSKINDFYYVTTTNSFNVTNTINGAF